MNVGKWFDDVPVIGRMSPVQAAKKLREMGVYDIPMEPQGDETEGPSALGSWNKWWRAKLWQHTGHAFGYIAPVGSDQLVSIRHAGSIKADASLKGARLKITLDRLRIMEYPGGGTHHVLFDFYAQNQAPGDVVEHLHFNATFRGREGEHAAVIGYPLFVGLLVGQEGVSFKCFTVNVKNDQDEALLGFLESDVFKAGLRIVTTAQPALAPLSLMAGGIAKGLAGRNKNVAVQDFYMGLDFSKVATRARLAEGSYLAVQIPEGEADAWDWSLWKYSPTNGSVVNATDPQKTLPYNYVVFGVSRLEPQAAGPQAPSQQV